jgi:predicted transcriptional regulator
MTKIEMFESLIAKYDFTAEEKAFLTHEVELVAKRNARKSTKPTKTQLANASIKDAIASALAEPMQAKAIGELVGISWQKASALLKQMVEDGRVVKTQEKGKSFFALAE